MNAVSVYVNTAKLVLQSTETTAAAASLNPELSRLLLNLRQLLSCVVCNRLANDPYAPQNERCGHNVCRLCVRGQKLLYPACSYCKDNKDFKTYNENKQLRCLLMCYKSLCEHLRCSSMFGLFAALKVGQYNSTSVPSVIVPQMSLQELIIEGCSYDDILNAFSSDLPKSIIVPMAKHQQMPALVTPLTSVAAATPLVPIQNPIKVTSMQLSVSKASTPPVSVSTPCSTYGPKLRVDHSSQHHFKPHTTMATSTVSLPNTPSTQEHHPQTTSSNTTLTHTQLIQLNQLKSSGNITYIGPNNRGIVVPIVSSAGSSAVPLSIASARLQNLNRQFVQARALAVSSASTVPTTSINTTTNSTEHRNSLGTFKGATTSSQTMKSIPTLNSSLSATASTNCVTTTSQLRNPPPIKTVSNGSAMYSVLYTGIGNKITIKRKTDGDEDTAQKKNTSISTASSNVLRPLSKIPNKKRGCRCGNTTATPGKLTCCGQRCPCYVDSKSCIGCKCRGCRNPHRPDGNKVRPIIPELACYEIQMADDLGNVNELPLATTSNVLNTVNIDHNATTNHTNTVNLNASTSSSAAAPITSPSSNTTLIPLRNLQHFSSPSVTSNSCITTSIIPPLASTTMPTQTSSMTQASFGSTSASSTPVSVATSISSNIAAPGSIVQLDQIQRESLLIQNAEGKFQVVNVFTTASGGSNSVAGQSSNQIPSLQRIKTMPQTVVSAHNSFVLPSSISSTSMSGTTTTTSLPQLILQSQQQQHQHQHQHQHQPAQHLLQHNHQHQHQQQHQQHHLNHQLLTTQRISNNITATSLPLQLQQQLKQNIITVHAIHTNPTSNTSPVTAPVLTPSSSPAPTSATLSLPPLISNNSHSGLELTDPTEIIRNNYTNIIVSSASSENIKTTSSSITSIPLTVSLAGTVHTQPFNRKSLNSPNF